MSLLRKLMPPTAGVAATAAGMAAGAPPELVTAFASSLGVFLSGVGTSDRSVDEVAADEANHADRARAYETFSGAVAQSWQWGSFINTFTPAFVGYVHGLMGLVRAQRRFEDQTSLIMTSFSSVLLYGSKAMQEASVALLNTLSQALTEMGRCKQGSPEAAEAQKRAGVPLGTAFVAWRQAAHADLAARR